MRLAWEEPFGPVLPFIRVSSVEEAIKISNESEFGLQGAVFTQDYPRAFAIAEQLEVGTVHINNKTQRGTDNFPFLGVKGSGAGTQGVKYSIEAMTRVKINSILISQTTKECSYSIIKKSVKSPNNRGSFFFLKIWYNRTKISNIESFLTMNKILFFTWL